MSRGWVLVARKTKPRPKLGVLSPSQPPPHPSSLRRGSGLRINHGLRLGEDTSKIPAGWGAEPSVLRTLPYVYLFIWLFTCTVNHIPS